MRRFFLLLIGLFAIACSPVRKYEQQEEVKFWERDIENFEKLDKSEIYADDAVLFAGSSSIRLWSSLEQDMYPYHVIQRGYGGAKLSDFAVYASRIVDPHQCRAIVIFVANDISGSKQDKTPDEVAGLFRNVLKTIRRKHPETPVIWIEVTPTPLRLKVWPQIQDENAIIMKICEKKKHTYFLKTDQGFLNKNGKPVAELFRSDSLHLSEKGYEVWKGIIKKELDKIIPLQ